MSTELPASRVAIVDPQGRPTVAFYRFMQSFWKMTGGATIPSSSLEQLLVTGTREAPVGQDPAPMFMLGKPQGQAVSQADIMQLSMLVQQQASAIQQLRVRLEQLEAYAYGARVATQ